MGTNRTGLDRRSFVFKTLAASAAALGARPVFAAADMDMKGTQKKVFKEQASIVPGFPKIVLRENTYAPGATSKGTMKSAMVCECTQGELEVKINGQIVATRQGDFWTCAPGVVEEAVNKGNGPAKMRVFELVPA